MAAKSKFYSKHIAHGSGILVFSILFAAIIRVLYFLNFGIIQASSDNSSTLWEYFAPLFSNAYISVACSTAIVGLLAFLTSHIDAKHVLIRQKTHLPSSFVILLFSSHPSFLAMSGEFVSAILAIIILFALFSSYGTSKKQHAAFRISFILAISSLFTTASLLYLPLLWAGLGIMRLFNTKAFIASVIAVYITYFPIFSYLLFVDKLDTFFNPFIDLFTLDYKTLPIFNYKAEEWIALGLSILLLLITVSDDFINRHKDKIKVRNYFNLLLLLCTFALISFLFININPQLHLFVAFISGAFILAHFFALVEGKAAIVLFYISLLLFILACFSPFLSFSL